MAVMLRKEGIPTRWREGKDPPARGFPACDLFVSRDGVDAWPQTLARLGGDARPVRHRSLGQAPLVARPALAAFTRDLELALTHRFRATVFLSPPASQAIAPHYDEAEVLALQLAGCKEWSLWEPAVPHALDEGFVEPSGPPLLTVVLE